MTTPDYLNRIAAEIAEHQRAIAALQAEQATIEQEIQADLAKKYGLELEGLYQYVGNQKVPRGRVVTLDHLLVSSAEAYVSYRDEQYQVKIGDLEPLDPFFYDTLRGVIHAKD